MCINNKNYFELCNEILSELYYEEVENFEDLDTIEEGKRVKKELNRALTFICNSEDGAWQFKETDDILIPLEGVSQYKKPKGYIRYLKYPKSNLILNYIDDHKYVPSYTTGMPVSYWMDGEKIRLFPIPDRTYNDNEIHVHMYTNEYARDCCGVLKPVMVCATDTPIIPNSHRDILIYKVCMDWRANLADNKTQYYQKMYKAAYRNMLADMRQSDDYPDGLHIGDADSSFAQQLLNIMDNPYTIPRPNTRGN